MFKLKQFVVFIFLAVTVSALYAEAPELKNVMPNSWRKVTRLTEAEEQAFMQENNAFFATINESMNDYKLGWYKIMTDDLGWGDGSKFGHYLIYKQRAGNDIFYRIVCVNTDSPDFFSPIIHFIQILVYKNAIVLAAPYHNIFYHATQRGNFETAEYYSLDVIEGRDGAKGILKTGTAVSIIDHQDGNSVRGSEYCKGQLFGGNSSHYFLMSEINKKIQGEEYTTINIEASDCLIDPNIPLRYSLQNAFDSDPATSYVENTENDLMFIHVGTSSYYMKDIIQRVAIINGYAQNKLVYKNNNRIKALGTEPPTLLSDNKLDYQFFDGPYQGLGISDIYKGDKYNDTCMAEYNIYTTMHGWLFGDIDE